MMIPFLLYKYCYDDVHGRGYQEYQCNHVLITLPIQTCQMWIKDLHLMEHGVKNYHDYEVEEIFLIFAS
jgi:hypothetical protein